VFDVAGTGNQTGDLLLTQDNGDLVRNAHRLHLRQHIAVTQSHIEQKLQSRDGGIKGHGRGARVDQVQLIAPQIFCCGSVRGAPQILCKSADRSDVGVPRLGRELAHTHILQHALTQRRDSVG
jgi:hypothetical protein